jgi:hypothetical protein
MCRKLTYFILLLTFGLTVDVTNGQTAIRVNFQLRATPPKEVPVGYLPDYGDVFGDRGNGWSYGWTVDKTASARDRDMNSDQRYDTLNALVMYNTGTGSWEIAVPNGTYNMFIVGGDPGYLDSTQSYLVEGVAVTDPTPYPPGNTTGNRFDEYYVTNITVADGRLTIAPPAGWGTNYIKICFVHIADVRLAQPVSPPDRGLWPNPTALLEWTAGEGAVQHDVYIGEDFNDVRNATTSTNTIYKGRQSETKYPASLTPMTLTPGKTYYWRIDEINGANISKGEVWIFKVQLLTAYDPQPFDGALFVDPNVILSWSKGSTVATHLVYFGDNYNSVKNATTSSPEYKGPKAVSITTWDPPGALSLSKTYYWRIDEKESGGTVYKGDVWGFTTATRIGTGVKGQYYNNSTFTEPPTFTRIDPQIDFDWGLSSPDPNIITNVDAFSVRWTGQVEIPAAGEWTFWLHQEHEARLWVNGQLLLNNNPGIIAWYSAPITLEAGFCSIMVEYVEHGNIALVRLLWQGPLVPTRQVIPSGAFSPPLLASIPDPNNGAIDIKQTPTLRWTAGDKAAQHNVYFGTSFNDVNSATTSTTGIYKGPQALAATSYKPDTLAWNTTYYWRVDEVNNLNVWRGTIWSFTTADFMIVEDFEDYNNFSPYRVFQKWLDGIGYSADEYFPVAYNGNGTGAALGHDIWTTGTPYTTIMETSIINGGRQSMFMDYNNAISPYYSETTRIFTTSQEKDWTIQGVKALSLWFRGIPVSVGSLAYDQATGTYTMTGSGADIWNTADQFHFAYKTLTGNCTIIARIDSITNTNAQAKAGVMIRDTLDPGSPLVDAVVSADNRVMFQWRETQSANMNSPESSTHTVAGAFALPHWIKLTRSGFVFTVQHSADGVTWQDIVPETAGDPLSMSITMGTTVFVGLAITSHNTSATCEAKISNVSITTPSGSSYSPAGPFTVSQDIGIASNDPAPMYVTLEDDTGGKKTVNHPDDPNAVLQGTWQEWNILLSQFTGVKLDKIKKMTIGTGNKTAGGSGSLYFDDIRIYKSRCVPAMAKPAGDLNDDCMVDYLDVDILAGDWLLADEVITTTPPSATGLMGHWKFDGNAADSSGNGRNGTINGTPQWAPVGHIDGALSFDGADDYVSLPIGSVIASMENCTVATWVNFSNSGGSWQRIFDFGNDPNFYMYLTPSTGTTGPMRFGITTGSSAAQSQITAPATLATGWHHVAAVIDGTSMNMQLYLDGVSIVSGTTQTLPKDLGNTTQNWLGRSQYDTDAYFTGALDDFRIYNRVLSKSEIAYLGDSTPGDGQIYIPLVSDADLYSMEAAGSRKVNFKDFAVLAATWLEEKLWP